MIYFTILFSLLFMLVRTNAQSSFDGNGDDDAVSSFHGSLAIVVGVMSVMLAVAVCALLYAKHSSSAAEPQGNDRGLAARSGSGMSGIDRTVIESLPFFRFASLKGSRDGLDCAVCLSRFEGSDVLRLLPKCKHAFHSDCVDRWLAKHSSCPLCRNKIDPEDVSIFAYSDSMRMLRDDQDRHGSSRFSIGSSFRRIREIFTGDQEPKNEDDQRSIPPRKSNVLSDVVFKHRWSNVSSSDIMFLSSEIGGDTPDLPQTTTLSDHRKAKRSMSDISGISRCRDVRAESINIGDSCEVEGNVKETRMRNLWLPIAKKTVLWFARREEKPMNKNSIDSLTFDV